jgi:hypothetical protein
MAIGLQRADAAPQKNALELLDMACGGHGLRDSLPRAGFLLSVLSGTVEDMPTWPSGACL